jgi:hypothetical protein
MPLKSLDFEPSGDVTRQILLLIRWRELISAQVG